MADGPADTEALVKEMRAGPAVSRIHECDPRLARGDDLTAPSRKRELPPMLWIIALMLFLAWGVAQLFFGQGGFSHILLLCAITFALVQGVANYRASQD